MWKFSHCRFFFFFHDFVLATKFVPMYMKITILWRLYKNCIRALKLTPSLIPISKNNFPSENNHFYSISLLKHVRTELTFDQLAWISIVIIYSSRTINLPSLRFLKQSVLDLNAYLAQCVETDILTDMFKAICPSFQGRHKTDIYIYVIALINIYTTMSFACYEA